MGACKAVTRTAALMADRSVPAIFEAAFEHSGMRVRVDILERLPRGYWGMREVKSSGERQVFEGIKLPRTLKSDLRKTVSFMYGKQWFHPADNSGVVIAGMGASEPFPVLYEYRIGTVAAGKLRYAEIDEARVGPSDAVVVPFAQRGTIDMIIGGIHPRLRDKLTDDVERWMPNGRKNGKAKNAKDIEKRKEPIEKRQKEFADYMRKEILQGYDQPFMGAVSALPRQDLAKWLRRWLPSLRS